MITGVMARALLGGRAVAERGIMSSNGVNNIFASAGGIAAPMALASVGGTPNRGFAANAKTAPRTWRAPAVNLDEGQERPREVQLELVEKYMSTNVMSAEELNRIALKDARAKFARHPLDCGSSEVQVAVLTTKIQYMIKHLLVHRKDHAARRGMQGMLETRRKLLKYLRRTDGDRYGDLIFRLGLRDNVVSSSKNYPTKQE